VIGQGFVSWHASRNCGSNYFEGEKMSFMKLAGGRLLMTLPENRAVQHYDCHVGKALF
jgi:hypothetical protein